MQFSQERQREVLAKICDSLEQHTKKMSSTAEQVQSWCTLLGNCDREVG